jgi:hypothetical protein
LHIPAVWVLCLCALAAGARADIIPGSQRTVGSWTLDAHDLPGKGFSHCTVFARYRSNITMIFSFSAQRRWNVGWLYPSWNLRPGQQIHLRYSIDGSPPAQLAATAKNRTLVAAELPANAGLFETMRQGRQMMLYAPGGQIGFSLDGTSMALGELTACVDRFTRPGSANQPLPAAPPTPGPQASARGKGTAAPVGGLPLKPGFYVNADTPCGKASFATLWYVDQTGVSIGHQAGTFRRIEKIDANRYRVTQELTDPRESKPETMTDIYVVVNPTTFRFGEGSGATEVRYCPSSSMPEPWRR